MDSDDNASMEPTRASARFAGLKTGKKKLVEDVDHVSSLGDRVNKKRRTGNTKPTKLGCSRQNVGFKCSPHLMHHLFQSLNEDQRIWVQEIGFGDLLSMPSSVLPKGVTVWLVNQVCWKERSLVLGGRSIQIKNVVKKILGIPDGLHPVPLPRCRRGKAKGSKVAVPERETKGGKSGRGVSYKTTYESLIATKDPVQFKRAFMLYVLCIYLAPSSGLFINKNYAAIINDVDLIKDMNWCHHVADVLIEGAREYRESKALNVNVHGCVHVLLLIYIDIVKSAFIKVPEGTPRAIYVNSVNLEMLDYHDLKFTTHEGAEYGKLEIDHQHDYFTSHGGCIPPKLPAMNKTKPGCSQAAYSEEDGKVVNDSIMKIETDFLVARDKAYEECFRALGKRMDIIDTIRSAAISQVLGKWFRGFPLVNPPSFQGTTAVFSQSATTGVKKKRRSVVKPVDCMLSTPQKQNSNSKTVLSRSSISAEKCEDIYGNNFSGEFSFKMKRSSRGQPNEYIISEVGTSTSSPCTPVVGPYACPTSAEFRPQSVDLQQNCRQFSTFLVISQEQRKFPRPPQQINRPSLVGVQHTTPVEATVPFDYDDPLGFDTMDNVAAWAKECEGQAVEDALKDGICSTYLSENMKDSEQAPFPCLGKEVISERYGPSVNPGHDKIMECKNAVFQQEGSFDQAAPDPSTDLVCTKLSSDHTSPNSDATVVIQKEVLKPVQLPCVATSSENPPLFRKQGKEKQPSILDEDSIRSAVNSITTHLTPQSRQFHIHVPQVIFDTEESMYIPPSPEHCSRYDVENVARVEAPIAGGEFFTDVGSVNLAVRSRAKRFGRSEEMIDAIADLNKSACKLKPAASATYEIMWRIHCSGQLRGRML